MKKILIIGCLFLVSFIVVSPVMAAPFPSLIPPECRGEALLSNCKHCGIDEPEARILEGQMPDGKAIPTQCCCDLTSVERMAVNVAQIVLGVSGSIALLMFVIGGVMFIFSGGESGKVQKAVTILKTTVIGLVIIILAGLGVQLLLRALTGT